MAIKILVENIPADMTEDRLADVFAQVGLVQSVEIRQELLTLLTDQPRDYGVVEMALDVDAYRAINCFEGATFKDRKIHVTEAYPLLEKAKSLFEHITDGRSLAGFNPRASFERWKEQFKVH